MSQAAPRGILRLDAADLVASAGAATTLAELDEALAAHQAWVALDPPGPRDQSLGSALERGAGGPLAALYGPPRDQVIGLSFSAGAGTTVKCGGRVVKNVAGFDLAKLVIGGHGAFGRILEVNLRLRAKSEADLTRAWSGTLESVTAVTRTLMDRGASPASLEVLDPSLARSLGVGASWTIVARALGTSAGAADELALVAEVADQQLRAADASRELWATWRTAVGAWPVIARVGASPTDWPDAVHLASRLGAESFSVTVPRGVVRAGFTGDAFRPLHALRGEAALRGWPLTVERAEPALLARIGIWGALNDGALALTTALRRTLGPEGTETIPLWA